MDRRIQLTNWTNQPKTPLNRGGLKLKKREATNKTMCLTRSTARILTTQVSMKHHLASGDGRPILLYLLFLKISVI